MTCTPTSFPYSNEVLLWIRDHVRSTELDTIARVLSFMGSEEFLLTFLCLGLWAATFKKVRYLIFITIFSTICNLALKELFHECRPDLSLRIMDVYGYSMPSGHAQISGTLWGWLALNTPNHVLKILYISLIFLVSLSRIYLGVHYLHNIIAGALIGVLLAWSFCSWGRPFFAWIKKTPRYLYVTASLLFCLLCSQFLIADDHFDGDKISGAFFATLCWLHLYKIKKSTSKYTVGWRLVQNIILGVLGVLVIRTYLQSPLLAIGIKEQYAHFIRYFVICWWAMYVVPSTALFFMKKRSA